MSGFVFNLLSRSRGTAAVVRPRLASLFEPGELHASPMEGQLPVEPDGEEALAIDRRAVSPAPPHQESTRSRSSHALRDERAMVATRDVPEHAAGRLLDPQNRPSAIATPAGERTTLPVTGIDVAAHEGSDHMAGSNGAEGRGKRAPDGQRPLRDGVSPTRAPTSVRPADSADPAALVDRGRRGFDTFHRMESQHLAAPPTEAARPTLVRAPIPRFRFEPSASRARALDPVVEVSIGRIEVRAVVERTADRKAPTTSPVMGLDEYLATRARRGAR
jgi:hypothetical protein